MKRKIILSFVMLCIAHVAISSPITQEEALLKAIDFFSIDSNTPMSIGNNICSIESQLTIADSRDAFYVFNNQSNGGYVVISGDDRMPTVLGYSKKGSYDKNTIPENMGAWLEGYAQQYEYLQSHPDAKFASTTSVVGEKISPLMKTAWNQSYPYNIQCPLINGKYPPCGCTATTMAQVMYYWKWPNETTTTIPGYGNVSAIEPTSIEWDNIFPHYSGKTIPE